jgi:uncharacterized membrane protein
MNPVTKAVIFAILTMVILHSPFWLPDSIVDEPHTGTFTTFWGIIARISILLTIVLSILGIFIFWSYMFFKDEDDDEEVKHD